MRAKMFLLWAATGVLALVNYGWADCQYTVKQPLQMRACALLGNIQAQRDYAVYLAMSDDLSLIGEFNRQWLLDLANEGDPRAERQMARLALSGKFGEKNESDALQWMEKAAIHQNLDAQEQLSEWLSSGFGGKKDPDAAKTWLMTAAANGHPKARYRLGESLINSADADQKAEACRWFRQAAEQYLPAAQRAAECYEFGIGGAVSEELAVKWYRKAAESNNPVAKRRLARLLLNQTDSEAHTEAAKWLKQAAEQQDAESQYWLGALYATGKGVKTDSDNMFKYYQQSAQNGYAPAQMAVGYLLETGTAKIPRNDAEAVKWYQKAAEQGDAGALYNLGLKYAKGEGVAQDYVLAYVCFNLASAAGNAQAAVMRNAAAALLSPNQLGEAQRLAREWRPGRVLGKPVRMSDGL